MMNKAIGFTIVRKVRRLPECPQGYRMQLRVPLCDRAALPPCGLIKLGTFSKMVQTFQTQQCHTSPLLEHLLWARLRVGVAALSRSQWILSEVATSHYT